MANMSYTKKHLDQIKLEFAKNKSLSQISKDLNIPRGTIFYLAKKAGVFTQFQGNTKYNISKDFLVEEYINKQKSTIQISKQLGCVKKTVLDALKRHGIKRRSTSEAQILFLEKNPNQRNITSPERKVLLFINKCFPNTFQYTGWSDFWIENHNPDFVDKKQKRIIEVFGDYWHRLPNIKSKDQIRIQCYMRYGYQTLIIWEHETKIDWLFQRKILNFCLGD